MSHFNLRKDTNCLNCNAEVAGRYCHVCGQENIENKESVWHLVSHFFKDITHFDGKFFSTLKYLLFKPGFISSEYIRGRRASYLNPVKMYVFTSAVFFLIFFSVFDFGKRQINITSKFNEEQVAAMDSTSFSEFTASINDGVPMTREEYKQHTIRANSKKGLHLTGTVYKSKEEYDSVLRSGKKDHNWLQRTLIYKEIQLNKEYDQDRKKIVSSFLVKLQQSFPQMLFLSLPLFALALQLLYIRRKQYYYTDHLIFSIHLYIFVFIVFLVLMGLNRLDNLLNWDVISWLTALLYVFLFYYEYKSMRNFYRQGRAKTLLKFILLNLMHNLIIMLLFIIFMLFSFLYI